MTTNSDFPELPPEELPAGSDVNDTPSGVVNSDDLDSSLMSGFSNLQIGNGDCPQTFSPIGSERTSPEQGTLQKGEGFYVWRSRDAMFVGKSNTNVWYGVKWIGNG